MIIILASQEDASARLLAERWSTHGAFLLSPANLSACGWQYDPLTPGANAAVFGRRSVQCSEITGVLTRLSWVVQDELMHIMPIDRAYVALEMNAFLLALLHGLACPLLNRPTPTCLAGPDWRKEQWVNCAARLGIPVHTTHRLARPSNVLSTDLRTLNPELGTSNSKPQTLNSEPLTRTVTVVGERCLGTVDEALINRAQRLAAAAEVQLLAVHFGDLNGEPRLFNADLFPDINSTEIADAILNYFGERRIR
jgi:hypothetical protein